MSERKMMTILLTTYMVGVLLQSLTVMAPGKARHENRKGPGHDPSDGGDPDGGDDPEYTEVRISRREADKVVVPPFPTVTHLESWMSQ